MILISTCQYLTLTFSLLTVRVVFICLCLPQQSSFLPTMPEDMLAVAQRLITQSEVDYGLSWYCKYRHFES